MLTSVGWILRFSASNCHTRSVLLKWIQKHNQTRQLFRCHSERKTALHNHVLWADRFFPWNPMMKVWDWNSNWEMIKQKNQKNGTCERLWRQWCHIAIIQDHTSYSKCSWWARISSKETAVVDLSRPVEFKTIPEPWIFYAWHPWRNTSRIFITRNFLVIFSRLFDRVPVRILTSDFHHQTVHKRPTRSEILIWSAVFLTNRDKFLFSSVRIHQKLFDRETRFRVNYSREVTQRQCHYFCPTASSFTAPKFGRSSVRMLKKF